MSAKRRSTSSGVPSVEALSTTAIFGDSGRAWRARSVRTRENRRLRVAIATPTRRSGICSSTERLSLESDGTRAPCAFFLERPTTHNTDRPGSATLCWSATTAVCWAWYSPHPFTASRYVAAHVSSQQVPDRPGSKRGVSAGHMFGTSRGAGGPSWVRSGRRPGRASRPSLARRSRPCLNSMSTLSVIDLRGSILDVEVYRPGFGPDARGPSQAARPVSTLSIFLDECGRSPTRRLLARSPARRLHGWAFDER